MAGRRSEIATIPGVLEAAASDHPSLPALIAVDGSTTSFADLWDRALDVAGGFIDVGLVSGDRIALWAPNSVAWVLAQLGAQLAGCSVAPLNTRYTLSEVGAAVDRASCRVIATVGEFNARDYADEAAGLRRPGTTIVTLDGSPSADTTLEALAATGPARRAEVLHRYRRLGADDIAHVQFTSGTTGQAKGALLRHGASVRTSAQWVRTTGLDSRDRYPGVAPFSHLAGHKTGVLTCLIASAAMIPIAKFDADELTRVIADLGVTFMQGPPTMFDALVHRAGERPEAFSTLQTCVTGAAVVPPTLVRNLHTVVGATNVFTAYGLTEATGVCCMTAAGDSVDTVATTSGRPLPGIEMIAVDADGAETPRGKPGEILVRSDSLMAGYLDDPEASAAAIRDGWLHTGDIGVVDADGRIAIVDRLKDMVIVGGFNVYPAEIEHILLQHPAVRSASVVGVADDHFGEVPIAFVVRREPGIDGETLTAWCRVRLAGFKLPRRIVFVDELPLNAAGKVAKMELRRQIVQPTTTGTS